MDMFPFTKTGGNGGVGGFVWAWKGQDGSHGLQNLGTISGGAPDFVFGTRWPSLWRL